MRLFRKILVVDDDVLVLDVTKQALERTGRYQVICTSSGREAPVLARQELPDLILLDINIPDMEGGAVAQALADSPETAEIPILFLTGIVTESDIDARGGVIGGRHMVAKGSGLAKILKRVDSMLSCKQTSRP